MKNKDQKQIDLFPEEAKIMALGIESFKVKENSLTATLTGVVNVADLSLIDNNCWLKAKADWLVESCMNNPKLIESLITEAMKKYHELQQDRELEASALNSPNVRSFPQSSATATFS